MENPSNRNRRRPFSLDASLTFPVTIACAAPRILIGNYGLDGFTQPLSQGLVAKKEERPVLSHRATQAAPELVPLEVWFAAGIEKVSSVKVIVALELVEAAVEVVGARLGDHIDLASRI